MSNKRVDADRYPVRRITDLKDIIVQSTEMFSDNTAYLVKDKSVGEFVPITYREVKSDIDAYGTRLMDMGLADKKIAVIGETRYEWLLTYFTTVTGVGVIVPLDKNLPEGELEGLIRRSRASALVYSDGSSKIVEELSGKKDLDLEYIISMDNEEDTDRVLSMKKIIREGRELLDKGNTGFTGREIDPDQMSTLLFTSGTTGLAKGAMISHRNIASNVYQMSQYFRIPEPGIVLSVLPVHHVYEMTCDIWTTFYQGKTIAICEGIRYIQKNMVETKANVMLGVPLVFEKMYKGMWKQARRRGEDEKLRRAIDMSKRLKLYRNKALVRRMFKAIHSSFGGSMQYFVMGGAAADPFVIEEFEAMGLPMVQGYGMTECSPIIALNHDRHRSTKAVGVPLPDTQVRIIDKDEDGVGEIIVKSPSVMLGYYDNEEATEEALQDGWLHTGDLGYMNENDELFITGRSKTVIVTKGGKNIFPEEVENVLLQDELIKEVIVHGVKDERVGNVMITADIFPNLPLLTEQHGEMSKSDMYHFFKELVDRINETMPPYKQVKRVNIRDKEFIKTTTGKIKRYGNKLSGAEVAGAESGKVEFRDLKRLEMKRAKNFVKEIAETKDPFVIHREIRPVTDVKDMLNSSREAYENNTAFLQTFDRDEGWRKVTYREMMADMEGFGSALINRGLDGKRIALAGRNNYQWQISFLAVMTGVGTAVPLDCELDEAEMERQLANAGAEAVIFDEKDKELFLRIRKNGKTSLETLIAFGHEDEVREMADLSEIEPEPGILSWRALVAEGKEQVSTGDRQYIDAEVASKDLAAIVYTSGAAGHAKAARITHQNLVANLMATASMVSFNETDTVFSVIPAHNIYQSGCGVLLPLYQGAAIANAGGTSETLLDDLNGIRPTILLAEPVMMQDLYDEITEEIRSSRRGLAFENLCSINRISSRIGLNIMGMYRGFVQGRLGGRCRMIISGGSRLEPEIQGFFSAMNVKTVEAYGMTECASVAAINPDDMNMIKADSAGHVIPGLRYKVVNRDRNGIGEILFKGPTVTDGYLNDDKETESAFKDGWFSTGDIGYVDEDDFVHLTGRIRP